MCKIISGSLCDSARPLGAFSRSYVGAGGARAQGPRVLAPMAIWALWAFLRWGRGGSNHSRFSSYFILDEDM